MYASQEHHSNFGIQIQVPNEDELYAMAAANLWHGYQKAKLSSKVGSSIEIGERSVGSWHQRIQGEVRELDVNSKQNALQRLLIPNTPSSLGYNACYYRPRIWLRG